MLSFTRNGRLKKMALMIGAFKESSEKAKKLKEVINKPNKPKKPKIDS